jgi:hypothetical protein
MRARKTRKIRVYDELVQEMRLKFPKVRDADLIQMTWNTSLLKVEAKLRGKRKQER